MKNRIITLLLAVFTVLNIMTTPAAAKSDDEKLSPTANTVIVKRNGHQGESYEAYPNRKTADLHEIIVYATTDDFPIKVSIADPKDYYNPNSYELTSYGLHHVNSRDIGFLFSKRSYATISVQAPPKTSTIAPAKQLTAEESLDWQWETLLDQINFPFYYREYSSYAKEVKAFLTGEWDGSDRNDNGDGWGSYTASRYVISRTYHWIASNLITGESYNLSANVDYNGEKEVIPGHIAGQNYSLAVSRINGDIEKWSLFKKQDAWKIDQVANGNEQIQNIIPLATVTSKEDDCQVFVDTIDADGQQHMYSLMLGGKVIQTV